MSLLKLARSAAAALLAACSGADSTAARDPEQAGAMAAGEASTTESTTLASSAEAAAMCELPSGGYTKACNGCLAAQCCGEIETCKNDPVCSTQLRCIIECQEDADPTECSVACTSGGDVHAGYVAYDDCSFVECLSTCWM